MAVCRKRRCHGVASVPHVMQQTVPWSRQARFYLLRRFLPSPGAADATGRASHDNDPRGSGLAGHGFLQFPEGANRIIVGNSPLPDGLDDAGDMRSPRL